MNIEDILQNSNSFSMYIEKEAALTNTTLFDMLLHACEKYNIEIENVVKMLSHSLKEKLEKEALNNKLLKERPTNNTIDQFF